MATISNPLALLAGSPKVAILGIVHDPALTDEQKGEKLAVLMAQLKRGLSVALHPDKLGSDAPMQQVTSSAGQLEGVDPGMLLAMAKLYIREGDRTMYLSWLEASRAAENGMWALELLNNLLSASHWQSVIGGKPRELILTGTVVHYTLWCRRGGRCDLQRFIDTDTELGPKLPVLVDRKWRYRLENGTLLPETYTLNKSGVTNDVALLGTLTPARAFAGGSTLNEISAGRNPRTWHRPQDVSWLNNLERRVPVLGELIVVAKGAGKDVQLALLGEFTVSRQHPASRPQ